ncbi:MAG: patatin-like phospholipase family protein [Pseudomonadota bacterium]
MISTNKRFFNTIFFLATICFVFLGNAGHGSMQQEDLGTQPPGIRTTQTNVQALLAPSARGFSVPQGDVIQHLQSFALDPSLAQELWQTSQIAFTSQSALDPFRLASNEPFFIARGIWQARQQESLQPEGSPLSWRMLLSCTLSNHLKLSKLTIDAKNWQRLSILAQSNPYFCELNCFQVAIDQDALSAIAQIGQLQELVLEEAGVTNAMLSVLVSHPSLSKLLLWKNKISYTGVKDLAQNHNLKELGLYKNPIGDEAAQLLAQHPALEILDLRECGIGDPGAIALSNNKILKSLRLRYNNITDQGAQAFVANHHLTHLEVSRNHVSEELVYNLENLMPSNGYLQLYNGLGSKHARTLGKFPQKDRIRILSIDGGGIRGLLPALVLKHIADQLNSRFYQPSKPGFHFAQHLDMMAGTSTGGLISLALAAPGERGQPKFIPDTLVDLYQNRGSDIFPATWSLIRRLAKSQYDPSTLEKELQAYFADLKLSSCLCHTLITAFDLERNVPHLFDSKQACRDERQNFAICGAARATSAAPTYFPAARIQNQLGEDYTLVDGGIYANNPTLLALKLAKQLYPQAKQYQVISLGTGACINRGAYSNLSDAGLIGWGTNIAGTLMSNMLHYTETLLEQEIKADPRICYTRIQPQLTESETAMDNVKSSNIKNLTLAAEATIAKHQSELAAIIADFAQDYERSVQYG